MLNNSNSISVYPNPSNGLLQINILGHNSQNGMVSIENLSGAKVFTSNFNSPNQQIDLGTLKDGLYIVTVNYNDNVHREKLIIKK